MDLNLKNKVAIVTGSAQGIGLAIAKLLQAEGCKVVINARHETSLSRAKAFFNNDVYTCEADMSTLAGCEKLISNTITQYGKLDILVCAVGLSRPTTPNSENNVIWQEMFENNLFSSMNMIELAKPHLEKTQGSIVCISSICGKEVIIGAPITYSAAKAALNMSIKGLARPLAKLGIRVNAVAPGNIIFPGSVWEKKIKDNPSEINSMLEKEVALARLGSPEEIANMVAFLASSKASFITGETFVVDGGQIRS